MKKISLLLFFVLLFSVGASAYVVSPDDDVATLFAKANQGDAVAQNNLGAAYYNGNGVPKDYGQAVYWYRKAAEQGNSNGQNSLGYCYEHGHGVEQDYNQAVYWYRKAAEQGNATAQNNLGYCYYRGHGVPIDYNQAVYWYEKALKQENYFAQNNIGLCYEEGKGKEKDYNQALYWYKKSAEQGNETAKNNLKRLEEKMAKEAVAQNSSSTTGTNTTVSNTTSTNTTTTNKTSTTSTSSSSSTRQYNDVATFDLKGNVKKCVYDGVTYEFDRNGKYKAGASDKVIYDSKGRISEINGDMYEYDKYGRVEIFKCTIELIFSMENIYIYEYDSKGHKIKTNHVTICRDTFDSQSNDSYYSDYKDDSHGNWISRKRKDSNGKVKTQTRTIEYY